MSDHEEDTMSQHVQFVPPESSRNRRDNRATVTTDDTMTAAQLTAFSALDVTKGVINQLKILGGCFKGQSSNQTMSPIKFFTTFKNTLLEIVKPLRGTQGAAIIENMLREFRDDERLPVFPVEYNELLFNVLVQTTDEGALTSSMQFEFSDDIDDSMNTKKMDGRRAYFVLLQTHMPESINAANIVKKNLEQFVFVRSADTIQTQRSIFTQMTFELGNARGKRIESRELWAFTTSSIRGPEWELFRTVISMQLQYKKCDTLWLIDQICENVLSSDLSSENKTTDIFTKKYSALGAATLSAPAPPDESTTQGQLNALTASVMALEKSLAAAITTATEKKPRVAAKTKDAKTKDAKPRYPCRFCQGDHYDRACPTLVTDKPKPKIPTRGTAGGVTVWDRLEATPGFLMGATSVPRGTAGAVTLQDRLDATPGFLMGATAAPPTPSSSPGFLLGPAKDPFSLKAFAWTIFFLIMGCIVAFTSGSICFQRNLRVVAMARGVDTESTNVNNFAVDSGASDHICNDASLFSSLDTSVRKQFQVVHGDNVTSSGVGTVYLMANTTSGVQTKLTLENVYFIPKQPMSLISVSTAIDSNDFSSPDFKKLTWMLDDSHILTMTRSNKTYLLDATVIGITPNEHRD